MAEVQDVWLEEILAHERERLVRLCARFSGSPAAAEDLAQESMAEAWRLREKLHDPAGSTSWLTAIARNVCLRWRRSASRHRQHEVEHPGTETAETFEDTIADDFDLEIEFERSELATLLDRALALLPPQTRLMLIQRYIDELPEGEMAARLGMSEGAVAGRLHRGRLALRRVLLTDLRDDAASHGFLPQVEEQWQPTRIWCWTCGKRRLLGRFTSNHEEFWLRCPACCVEPGTVMAHAHSPDLFSGAMSYRRALTRMVATEDGYYQRSLGQRFAPCQSCGRPAPVRLGPSSRAPRATGRTYNVHIPCDACGLVSDLALGTIAFLQPAGQQLWSASGRIRTLPERVAEINDREVILVGLEDVLSDRRVQLQFAADTFEILAVHTGS